MNTFLKFAVWLALLPLHVCVTAAFLTVGFVGYLVASFLGAVRDLLDATSHQKTVVIFQTDVFVCDESSFIEYFAKALATEPGVHVSEPQGELGDVLRISIAEKLKNVELSVTFGIYDSGLEDDGEFWDWIVLIDVFVWKTAVFLRRETRLQGVDYLWSILSGIVEAERRFRNVRLLTRAEYSEHVHITWKEIHEGLDVSVRAPHR